MHLYDMFIQPVDLSLYWRSHLLLSKDLQRANLAYSFSNDQHQLQILNSQFSKEDTDKLVTSSFEAALVIQKEFFFWLCRFGKNPWIMTPFQWHRTPAETRQHPDLFNLAKLKLVFAREKMPPLATRTVICSPEFTASLCGAILMQASYPWEGEQNYQITLKKFLQKYKTPEELVPLSTARILDIP